MLYIINTIIFIFGISIGSFLNCLIYRIEEEEKMKGRSFCPNCRKKLSFWDLFPILSYLFLMGKCRYCKKKISFQYPLVEILTGIVFLFLFNYFFDGEVSYQFIYNLFLLFIISSISILIFVYDFKHLLIPDIATYLLIFFSLIYLFLNGNIVNGILSSLASFIFFLSIFLITKGKGMGFGDVKLSIFIGLFLGYPHFISALFISFFLGALVGTMLILLKRKKIKSELPFGPFLIIGTFLTFFWGDQLIGYYLNLF